MEPLVVLRSYMERNHRNVKAMAFAMGMSSQHFGEVLGCKRRLPLHAIRNAVALGLDARVMVLPFPNEELDARRTLSNEDRA